MVLVYILLTNFLQYNFFYSLLPQLIVQREIAVSCILKDCVLVVCVVFQIVIRLVLSVDIILIFTLCNQISQETTLKYY